MPSNKWLPIIALIGMACIGLGIYSILHKSEATFTPIPPTPTSSVSVPNSFSITDTEAKFVSTLDLLGSYEIVIPADNQWHNTNIEVRPNMQLQIGFIKGTEGNVNIQIGEYSAAFAQAQPPEVYYEYDFRNHPPEDKFHHILKIPGFLRVQATQNNVVIRVEVRRFIN